MLHFIGVGSAFNPKDGNTSAYFTRDRRLYLIDCGSLVFKELIDLVDFNQINQVEIFISHSHSDHIGSLGTLISYLYHKHKLGSTIYHGGLEIKKYLDLVGVSSDYYQKFKVQSIELAELSFEWIPTKHSERLASYGLLIQFDQLKIYYSADAAKIPKKIYDDFMNDEIDYLYQDVTTEPDNDSHLNLQELAKLIPSEMRERVFAMHLEEDSKDTIRDFGFKVAKRTSTGGK